MTPEDDGSDPGFRFLGPSPRPRALAGSAAAALQACGLPAALDRDVALAFLAHDAYDFERCFFRGLTAAPPRCAVARGADGVLSVAIPRAPRLAPLSSAEAARALRAALVAAVGRATAPFTRVGVLLSGGMDSSAVSAAASEAWRAAGRDPGDLRLYHMLPASGRSDAPHAQAVASRLGHPYAEVPSHADPFHGCEEVFSRMDVPPDGSDVAGCLLSARRMAADGVEVSLTGDGGDEVAGRVHLDPRSPLSRWLRGRVRALFPAVFRARDVRRALAPMPPWLADRVRTLPPPRRWPPARTGLSGERERRDRLIRCARQQVLVAWWRACASACGMEAAFPFFDPAVEDLAVSLPPRVIDPPGLPKGLLREAFRDVLPETQRVRPKDQPASEAPFVEALRRERAGWEARWQPPLARAGLLSPPDLHDLVDRALRADDVDVARCVAALSLGAWLEARGLT